MSSTMDTSIGFSGDEPPEFAWPPFPDGCPIGAGCLRSGVELGVVCSPDRQEATSPVIKTVATIRSATRCQTERGRCRHPAVALS